MKKSTGHGVDMNLQYREVKCPRCGRVMRIAADMDPKRFLETHLKYEHKESK